MDKISFEWDDNKAKINLEKHGVTFEEAATVFADEFAIIFDDPDHSENDERSIILGFSANAKLLIVCHCVRGSGFIIRIISARKATRTEAEQYTDINHGW